LLGKNPRQAEQLRSGKTNLLGFFVGQVMKETSGSADPKLVSDLIQKLVKEPP
jgi:aspartyl-tRNA(Asn)/glutamyl-tRNA(Gln) amidotransferase subunit B